MTAPLAIIQCLLAPQSAPTVPPPEMKDGVVTFQSLAFGARGSVTLGVPPPGPPSVRETLFPRPVPSASGVGWRAGWIQLCVQDEIWGLYRGETPDDGTMLAKWTPGSALDMDSNNTRQLFVVMGGNGLKYLSAQTPSVEITFNDFPVQQFHPTLRNTATNKDNRLAVAVVRMSFILALAARDPDDHMHVLKHMFWWIRWEANFKPGPGPLLPATLLPSKTESGMSGQHDGGPPRLMAALAGAIGGSANTIAQNSVETSYRRWADLTLRPAPEPPPPPRPRPGPRRP